MKTNVFNFNLPEFLLAEFPIKDNSLNDQRHFIVHKGITLIEVIPHDEFTTHIVFDTSKSIEKEYFGEVFTLAYHTCNAEYYNLQPKELLEKAWQYYKEYLLWEDLQQND